MQFGSALQRFSLIVLFVFGSTISACGDARSSTPRPQKDPDGFFRVFAEVRVRETGEIVKIDYVASCGAITTNWSYTTSSTIFGMAPHIMIVPTGSGELIGARTPDVCDAAMWRDFEEPEETGPDSETFLPLLMWYPDANDIGFAIGYLSDKAYESPYSKMDLLSSGITKASLEDWKAWRAKAEAEFEPVGALPGPWGHQKHTHVGSSREHEAYLRSINGGRDPSTYLCHAAGILDLPPERRDELISMLPMNESEWLSVTQIEAGSSKAIWQLLNKLDFSGYHYAGHQRDHQETGVRKSRGQGAFFRGGKQPNDNYHDVWPIVPAQPKLDAVTGEVLFWEHVILQEDNWNGFGICGDNSPSVEALTAYAEGRSETLKIDYSRPIRTFPLDRSEWEPDVLTFNGDTVLDSRSLNANQDFLNARLSGVVSRSGKVMPDCCAR